MIDLSYELLNINIYPIYCDNTENTNIQIARIFDQMFILPYLNLYNLSFTSFYYINYYKDFLTNINSLNIQIASVAIRNANMSCFLPLLTYKNFILNLPTMLESIPLQRILNERKNKFDTAIVVSAGPSLKKQLPLLKQYQEKAFIFCADGAYPILDKEGIIPDYVLNIDYQIDSLKFFTNTNININTLLILSITTNKEVINFLRNKNISLVLRDKALYQRFNINDFGYIDTGTHVSHFSYTLALSLGFKNIIIIGQDLAFDEKGNSHSENFSFGTRHDSDWEECPRLTTTAYGGNGEVLTHLAWNDYRIKLEYLFARYENINFYNATEGGARIAFTKEIPFKTICEKLLKENKPKLNIPKTLTKNKSEKLFIKTKEKIYKDKLILENFINDANTLKQALITILNSDKDLPLSFLENVYKNIQNFNTSLDNDEYLNDEVLRGMFVNRGYLISNVIKELIQDEKIYLLKYINAYNEFLDILLEKLNEKLNCLNII